MKHLMKWLALAAALFMAAPAFADGNMPKYNTANGNRASAPAEVRLPPAAVTSNSSGNVANASAVATLTPSATQIAYLMGFRCDPGGSTGAALVSITVAGISGGTATYTAGTPAGATLMGTPVQERFDPPLPASAVNTPIVVTMPALGAGNAKASCVAVGFVW